MTKIPNEHLLYQLALSLIPKIGPTLYRNILAYSGSSFEFFKLTKGKASKIPGIGQKLIQLKNCQNEYLKQAEELLETCQKKDIRVLTFEDPDYPRRLKNMEDFPMAIFVKGEVQQNPNRTLGIVGTRNVSSYGKDITRKIIEDVSPFQPTIISGLAYGVDIEAHKCALQYNLPTIAVLGSSVDKIYPALHKNVAVAMLEKGGLLSEYAPGTEMHPGNFPQRNRIIAGLSDALIVVEAAKKGGALITAEIAYSYNKEVFAVPGNLQSIYSEGCNNLIRSMKAAIYTGPKDLEETLSWSKESNENQKNQPIIDWEKFDIHEKKILKLLTENKEIQIDQLAHTLEIPVSALASYLLNLEFEGLIRSLPGKKYCLIFQIKN